MKIVEKSNSIVLLSSLMSGDVFKYQNEYFIKIVPLTIYGDIHYNAVSLDDGTILEISLNEEVTIPNSVELTIT